MKNFFNKKFSTKTKLISSAISLMLIVCFAITGTVAWLVDKTDTVQDTFTYGKVDIELVDGNNSDVLWKTNEDNRDAKANKLIPGATIPFTPYVKVVKGSEDCYVFVEITNANLSAGNPAKDLFNNYTVTTDWEVVETTTDTVVYIYKNKVSLNADAHQWLQIIDGNALKVNTALANGDVTSSATPAITITAYAIQADHLGDADTDAEIWDLIDPNTTPYTPAP